MEGLLTMGGSKEELQKLKADYRYGFHQPEVAVFKANKGLSRGVVEEISARKGEPVWMREKRLQALGVFQGKPLPTWGGNLKEIDFADIYYYLEPTDRPQSSWAALPKEIRETYDKIGLPEAEKNYLAGVKAQYESVVVYGSLLESLRRQGVVFWEWTRASNNTRNWSNSILGRWCRPVIISSPL
jgi:Fe-S cluster assembly protein SufB